MGRDSIEQAIPEGHRVLLDTAALIAYLDGSEKANPVATHVMDDFVKTGRNQAVISMITVMELMAS